jgi:hypothetical protein
MWHFFLRYTAKSLRKSPSLRLTHTLFYRSEARADSSPLLPRSRRSQPPLLETSRLLLRPWPRKPRRRPSLRYAAPGLLYSIISSGAHTSRSGLSDPVGTWDGSSGRPQICVSPIRWHRAGSGYARRPDLGLLVGIVSLPLLIPKWRAVDLVDR